MPGPLAAGMWMAIGETGRRAAKKFGFLIARKKFPKLFKKAPKKDKTPDTKKTAPEKKPSTEKKKPDQTLSNEQVAKYLDLQKRRPNAYKKVPDWIKDTVRKRSAQVRDQQGAAYQRGQKMKPSREGRPKGRKVQGGNKKPSESAEEMKDQLRKPQPKLRDTTAKEREGKVKKVTSKKSKPKLELTGEQYSKYKQMAKDKPDLYKKVPKEIRDFVGRSSKILEKDQIHWDGSERVEEDRKRKWTLDPNLSEEEYAKKHPAAYKKWKASGGGRGRK